MKKKLLIIVVIIVGIAALTFFIVNSINDKDSLAKTDKNISENHEENVDNKENTENKEIEQDTVKKLESVEPIVIKINDNVYCEILPEMELIAGVMSQTKWVKDMAAKDCENIYFDKIQEFFSKYSIHRAVNLSNELINLGFAYNAPVTFALSLDKLPNIDILYEYPDYVVERAGGAEKLEEYRLALKQIAEESNFMQFFEDNREDLTKYLEDSLKIAEFEKVIEWNNNYYGVSTPAEYRLVFAPSYFPRGGYGPSIEKDDGNVIFYQVLTNLNNGTNIPSLGSKHSILYMALHEWGHSYSDPVLEKFAGDLEKYNFKEFMEPVKERLIEVGYTDNIQSFFNEQVLRGCIITGLRELSSKENVDKTLSFEKNNGFYLTEFTAEVFKEYTANRDKYKTYEDFIPYLLEQFNENREELLKLAQ